MAFPFLPMLLMAGAGAGMGALQNEDDRLGGALRGAVGGAMMGAGAGSSGFNLSGMMSGMGQGPQGVPGGSFLLNQLTGMPRRKAATMEQPPPGSIWDPRRGWVSEFVPMRGWGSNGY